MGSGYNYVPQGLDAVVARLKTLEKRTAQIGSALAAIGLKISPDGDLIFNGSSGKLIVGDPTGKRIEVDGDGPDGTEEIRFFYDADDVTGVPIMSGNFGDAWDLLVQGKDVTDHGVTCSVQFGIQGANFVVQGEPSADGPGPSLTVGLDGLNPGGGISMSGAGISLDATESVEITAPVILDDTGGDPAFVGALYVKSGALYFKGWSGTVTKVANA